MATARPKGKGYEIRVSLGYDINGKKLSRSISWTPAPNITNRQIAKELERQKVLLEEKARSGLLLDGNIKFADFAEKWLSDYAEKQLKKKTLYRYKELLKRINLAIGHIQLEKLRPNHLMEFYDNLEEEGIRVDTKYKPTDGFSDILKSKGLTKVKLAPLAGVSIGVLNSCTQGKNVTEKSATLISAALEIDKKKLFMPINANSTLSDKTVLHYHRLISSILSTAVKWQVLYSNPCSRVSPPKVERKEAKYLDETETAQLLSLLEEESIQFQAMVKLLIYTGMRRGELCGLEWGDIDFAKCMLHIQRNSLYLPEEGIFEDTTKNYTSDRIIKLSASAIDMLKQYKSWQAAEQFSMGDRWYKSNRLFTTCYGKPIHPDTVTGQFSNFIKKNNLPDISIHSLRHTNATLLIAAGLPLSSVKNRLGHAQETTTRNIYSHAIKSLDAVAAEALDDILNPTVTRSLKKNA